MTFDVIVAAGAERDWNEAVDWYEEREPGLGLRFTDELCGFLQTLAHGPDRFPRATRLTRKAKMPLPWPHSVYFTVNTARRQVIVLAVWHGARDPAGLRHRVK